MNSPEKLPFLLSIVLYSLLILAVVMFSSHLLTVLNHDKFRYLHEAFSSATSGLSFPWMLYSPIAYLVVFIYSLVMMIRKKKHAYYMFSILSFFVFIILAIHAPTDYLNMILITLFNLFIWWKFLKYLKANTKKVDDEMGLEK